MAVTTQLALTDWLQDVQETEHPYPPSIFGSPARGLAAREAEFAEWRRTYGSFGSVPRSHAWTQWEYRHESRRPGAWVRCQATVLAADTRCPKDHPGFRGRCYCVGDLLWRGACWRCTWEGDPRLTQNQGAEDACDHAWPGWRDLPVMDRLHGPMAEERNAKARWAAAVVAAYPAGWCEAGGPVRTRRRPQETRHVPAATPWLGYDMGVRQ